jgi:hypothetical protein
MINVLCQDQTRIVVPLRLTRAAVGLPVDDAPEIDDRGWIQHRPANFGTTDARGPQFGMSVGATVTVRIIREDIDGDAPLFATVSTAASPQFEVLGTGQVSPEGDIRVRAIRDTTATQKVEIRLGSTTGPVIFEIEPHVFTPRTLRITPHIVTIHQAASPGPGTGVAPTIGGAPVDIARIFRIAQSVWRPAGVVFDVGGTRNDEHFGFARDDMPQWQNPPGAGSENTISATNRAVGRLNIYFTRFMENSLGVGINRASMAGEGWTNPGILVAIEGQVSTGGALGVNGPVSSRGTDVGDIYHLIANDIAHEIGHYLTLTHAGNVNSPGLGDTYARRQLMFPNNKMGAGSGTEATPRFDDIGYGERFRGCLLTCKQFATHANDGEIARARRAFNDPNLY